VGKGGLPRPERRADLERAEARRTLHYPSAWTVLFLLFTIGGIAVYAVEAWLAWSGAFPVVVLGIVALGYVLFLYVTTSAWERRGRGP
jgi:hypothetical protein